MAKQGIDTGGLSGIGADTLYEGALKINNNFDEIYNTFGDGTTLNPSLGSGVVGSAGTWSVNAAGIHTTKNVGIGTELSTSALTVEGDARFSGVITAISIVKSGGTSSEFLKADGSVDNNTYLTAESQTLDSILALGNTSSLGMSIGVVTATRFESISAGTSTLDSPNNLNINAVTVAISTDLTVGRDLDVVGNTTLTNLNASGIITASSFVKSGGTSSEFLKADGTSDSNTYITGVGIQSSGTIVGYGVTTLNFVGTGNTFVINGTTVDISISGSGGGGGESYWIQTDVGIHTLGSVGIGTTNPTSKLTVNGNVLISGITTVAGGLIEVNSSNGGRLKFYRTGSANANRPGSLTSKKNISWSSDTIVPDSLVDGNNSIFSIDIADNTDSLTGQFFAVRDPYGDIDLFNSAAWCIQPSQTGWEQHQTWFRSSGKVGFGTTNPSAKVDVRGDLLVTGIATVGLANTSTPPNNSQLSFELISDTQLRIKVRGSDGVLRSADITLA